MCGGGGALHVPVWKEPQSSCMTVRSSGKCTMAGLSVVSTGATCWEDSVWSFSTDAWEEMAEFSFSKAGSPAQNHKRCDSVLMYGHERSERSILTPPGQIYPNAMTRSHDRSRPYDTSVTTALGRFRSADSQLPAYTGKNSRTEPTA